MQQKQQVWLPIIASAGIGVAAYYSMTRGQGTGKTLQQYVPLVAGMTGQGQGQGLQQNAQQQYNQQQTSTQDYSI